MKKVFKFLEKYNIKIDDDLKMVVPKDVPDSVKERLS